MSLAIGWSLHREGESPLGLHLIVYIYIIYLSLGQGYPFMAKILYRPNEKVDVQVLIRFRFFIKPELVK